MRPKEGDLCTKAQKCSEFLEREGYRVIPAANPSEARRKLEGGRIDLAILDLRLEDDKDEKDISGLVLAREVAHTVPKIILTRFPEDSKVVREALIIRPDGFPAAVDFVDKKGGSEVLLQAVRNALHFGPGWLRNAIDGATQRLERDYDDARRQSRMNYIASLVVAGLGILIIFVGAGMAISGMLALGIASAIGGIVTEAVTYLFFRRVDLANARMDRYHAEVLQIKRFENLLAACDDLSPSERREAWKEKVIGAATAFWFECPEAE